VTEDAADQACGRHAAGYGVGAGVPVAGSPECSSGTRKPNPSAASSIPATTEAAASVNPARSMPCTAMAVSCIQTLPPWYDSGQ